MAKMERVDQCCWCYHTKTCAYLVTILGLALEVATIGIFYPVTWIIVLTAFGVIAYVIAFAGIIKESLSFLMTGLVFLAIKLLINGMIMIFLIVITLFVLEEAFRDVNYPPAIKLLVQFGVKNMFNIVLITLALMTVFMMFAFGVIRRCRRFYIARSKTTHLVNGTVTNQPPPGQEWHEFRNYSTRNFGASTTPVYYYEEEDQPSVMDVLGNHVSTHERQYHVNSDEVPGYISEPIPINTTTSSAAFQHRLSQPTLAYNNPPRLHSSSTRPSTVPFASPPYSN